jgi:phosphatidylinositol-3,4,5-trisphosphate 3-phosphatase/dual-specificity protein phosphatase PTEN
MLKPCVNLGWERHTRSEDGKLAHQKSGVNQMEGETFAEMFTTGRYDKDKMVRSFARLGAVEDDATRRVEDVEVRIFPIVINFAD